MSIGATCLKALSASPQLKNSSCWMRFWEGLESNLRALSAKQREELDYREKRYLENPARVFPGSVIERGNAPSGIHAHPSAYRSHTLNFWRYSGRNSLPIPGLSGARTALFTMRSRSNVDPAPLKLPDSM